MKSVNPNREYDQLLRLIERYFDGETSAAEEKCLRRMLVETDCNAVEVEEARAVMGVFATARSMEGAVNKAGALAGKRRAKRRLSLAAISAAASIAVIIVAVMSILHPGRMSEEEMLATASGNVYDSIARIRMGEAIDRVAGHRMLAMAGNRINQPDNPDEIAALISSEMGLMAEAERSVYESIADDFTSLRDIPFVVGSTDR
ncbi:MAG: hypothetical protein K2L73_04045 [Muribaculaceae bacterium]|nr:hypothetical protein [Muribaculaceae bacterium]